MVKILVAIVPLFLLELGSMFYIYIPFLGIDYGENWRTIASHKVRVKYSRDGMVWGRETAIIVFFKMLGEIRGEICMVSTGNVGR